MIATRLIRNTRRGESVALKLRVEGGGVHVSGKCTSWVCNISICVFSRGRPAGTVRWRCVGLAVLHDAAP